MDISGISSGGAPKVDVELRSKAADGQALKSATRIASAPDEIDQQTSARAVAAQKKVSETTLTEESDKPASENKKANVSRELSYALTQEALKTSNKPEF